MESDELACAGGRTWSGFHNPKLRKAAKAGADFPNPPNRERYSQDT